MTKRVGSFSTVEKSGEVAKSVTCVLLVLLKDSLFCLPLLFLTLNRWLDNMVAMEVDLDQCFVLFYPVQFPSVFLTHGRFFN